MRILFKTNKLAKQCNDTGAMSKALGPSGARKLRARLADLNAAENMEQVRFGRPHPLTGRFKSRSFQNAIALDLNGGNRLVLESAEDPPPRLPDGGLDWAKVDAVRVIFIGDYHG